MRYRYDYLDLVETGSKIRWWRRRSGVSQLRLANILGISTTSVVKWETGLCLPSLENAVRLADLFGIEVEDFIVTKEES